MGASFPAYLKLLGELSAGLERLAELAQDKAAAARQDDLLALDEVLKQEQAMTLSLRGLEQRRSRMVDQLGLNGVSLADLPEHCPPELEADARRSEQALRDSYKVYRSCADMARATLELNLHQIEKVITASGGDPVELGMGYRPAGSEPPKNMKTDFRA